MTSQYHAELLGGHEITGPHAKFIDGDLLSPAALAIEILSPGPSIGTLFDRAGRILAFGTPLCIIIWPERRRVWAYSSADLLEVTDYIPTGIQDFKLDVHEMWNCLDTIP